MCAKGVFDMTNGKTTLELYDIDGVGPHRSNGMQANYACTNVFEDSDAVPLKTYNLTSSQDAECRGNSKSDWMVGLQAAPALDAASLQYEGVSDDTSAIESACFFNDTIHIVQSYAAPLDLVVVDSAVYEATSDMMLVVHSFGDPEHYMCLVVSADSSTSSASFHVGLV